MIAWLKQRLSAWVGRHQQRELDRPHAAGLRLKAEVQKSNGGRPIRLSPDQHRRLNESPKKIDPEALRRIDLFTDEE